MPLNGTVTVRANIRSCDQYQQHQKKLVSPAETLPNAATRFSKKCKTQGPTPAPPQNPTGSRCEVSVTEDHHDQETTERAPRNNQETTKKPPSDNSTASKERREIMKKPPYDHQETSEDQHDPQQHDKNPKRSPGEQQVPAHSEPRPALLSSKYWRDSGGFGSAARMLSPGLSPPKVLLSTIHGQMLDAMNSHSAIYALLACKNRTI